MLCIYFTFIINVIVIGIARESILLICDIINYFWNSLLIILKIICVTLL